MEDSRTLWTWRNTFSFFSPLKQKFIFVSPQTGPCVA